MDNNTSFAHDILDKILLFLRVIVCRRQYFLKAKHDPMDFLDHVLYDKAIILLPYEELLRHLFRHKVINKQGTINTIKTMQSHMFLPLKNMKVGDSLGSFKSVSKLYLELCRILYMENVHPLFGWVLKGVMIRKEDKQITYSSFVTSVFHIIEEFEIPISKMIQYITNYENECRGLPKMFDTLRKDLNKYYRPWNDYSEFCEKLGSRLEKIQLFLYLPTIPYIRESSFIFLPWNCRSIKISRFYRIFLIWREVYGNKNEPLILRRDYNTLNYFELNVLSVWTKYLEEQAH